MKISSILTGAVLCLGAVIATTSCESSEKRLVGQLAGTWAGTPETVTDGQALTATVTDTYFFAPDSALISDGKFPVGPLYITAAISMNSQIVAEGESVEPLSLTASAVANVRGTWSAIDHDEISLSIDPQTLTVIVDPDQLMVTSQSLTSMPQPEIEKMRPQVAKGLEQALRTALAHRYGSMKLMDDVKIKGTLLKYESGHEDFVLTRQGEKLGE